MSTQLLRLDDRLDVGGRTDDGQSRSTPLADRLWRAVVDDIARGRLKPGQRLRESFLERTYDASRLSVREALRTLEAQGIVVKVPHSGCRVMDVDDAMACQVFKARLAIEQLAVADLMDVITSGGCSLSALENAIERMDRAACADQAGAFEEADLAFHHDICRLSGNRTALLLWQSLESHVRIARGLVQSRVESMSELMRQHVELLSLVRTADLETVHERWADHLLQHVHQTEPS